MNRYVYQSRLMPKLGSFRGRHFVTLIERWSTKSPEKGQKKKGYDVRIANVMGELDAERFD